MSGQHMRKLMEAASGQQNYIDKVISTLEARAERLRGTPIGEGIREKRIPKWEQIKQVVDNLNTVHPINPVNPRTSAYLGGDGAVGIAGSPEDVLSWLKDNIPAKYRAVTKNLSLIDKLSPEKVTWHEGVLQIKAVAPGRGDFYNLNPGAHVLIMGETESGDDIRFFAEQGSTGEGGSRQVIMNGNVYKSGKFADFTKEFI
jgi:hypothetical protein